MSKKTGSLTVKPISVPLPDGKDGFEMTFGIPDWNTIQLLSLEFQKTEMVTELVDGIEKKVKKIVEGTEDFPKYGFCFEHNEDAIRTCFQKIIHEDRSDKTLEEFLEYLSEPYNVNHLVDIQEQLIKAINKLFRKSTAK